MCNIPKSNVQLYISIVPSSYIVIPLASYSIVLGLYIINHCVLSLFTTRLFWFEKKTDYCLLEGWRNSFKYAKPCFSNLKLNSFVTAVPVAVTGSSPTRDHNGLFVKGTVSRDKGILFWGLMDREDPFIISAEGF